MATPWLIDGPRKKRYEEALDEVTRELRTDAEINVKVTMNRNFEPVQGQSGLKSRARPLPAVALFERISRELSRRARPSSCSAAFAPLGWRRNIGTLINPANSSRPRTFTIAIQADRDRAVHVIETLPLESLQGLTQSR